MSFFLREPVKLDPDCLSTTPGQAPHKVLLASRQVLPQFHSRQPPILNYASPKLAAVLFVVGLAMSVAETASPLPKSVTLASPKFTLRLRVKHYRCRTENGTRSSQPHPHTGIRHIHRFFVASLAQSTRFEDLRSPSRSRHYVAQFQPGFATTPPASIACICPINTQTTLILPCRPIVHNIPMPNCHLGVHLPKCFSTQIVVIVQPQPISEKDFCKYNGLVVFLPPQTAIIKRIKPILRAEAWDAKVL